MDKKLIIQPIKHQVFAVLFMIALLISNLKPNINYLPAEKIAEDIVGIGVIKSKAIVLERNEGGVFKDVEDFKNRVAPYGVGNVTINKVVNKYKIGE